jgi:hypothetical protein
MAWEWVAPVSAAGGASIGTVTTWLTGMGGRRHARDITRSTLRHAELMAAEERHQQRLADAYVQLLTTIQRLGQWAELVRPMVGPTPQRPLPDLEEQAQTLALVGAYASPSVAALYEEYAAVIKAMLRADSDIRREERQGAEVGPGSTTEPWRKLEMELRPAEITARRKLAEQIATELRGDVNAPTDQV